jgi:hypothetical protein
MRGRQSVGHEGRCGDIDVARVGPGRRVLGSRYMLPSGPSLQVLAAVDLRK